MDTANGMLVVTILVVSVLELAIRPAVGWRRRSCSERLTQRQAQEPAEVLLRDVLTEAEYVQHPDQHALTVLASPASPRGER